MSSSNEKEFLERINKIAALFSLGREDIGQAMAVDTLDWVRNTSDDLVQQIAVLLQLAIACKTQLTVLEREHYSEQLINLIVSRFDEAILNPTAVNLIDSLDILLSGVSKQFVERWSGTVADIIERRNSVHVAVTSVSPLEEVVSLDEPNIPPSLVEKLVSANRLMRRDNNDIKSSIQSIYQLISGLRDELNSANRMSNNSRNILNGEINYLELIAGVKAMEPKLMLHGAKSLFKQSRRMSGSDKIIAAEVSLRVIKILFKDKSSDTRINDIIFSDFVGIPFSDFILERLRLTLGNSFLRFLALNIKSLKSLVDVYLDVFLEHELDNPNAVNVLSFFQGCFYSKCVRNHKLHQGSDYAELFVKELSQLLEHAQEENQRTGSALLLSESIDRTQAIPQLTIKNTIEEDEWTVNLEKVKRQISEAEALFVYYCTEQKIHLLVIDRNVTRTTTLEIGKTEVLKNDSNMRSSLHALYLSEDTDYSWIYDMLLNPGIELLGRTFISSIIIVDSQLMLPFHLAYNTQNGQFLIEKYEISYCHSLTTFYQSRLTVNKGVKVPRILLSGYAGNNIQGELPLVNRELSMIQSYAIQYGCWSSAPANTFSEVEHTSQKYNVFHFSGHVTGNSTEENAWTLHYRDSSVPISDLLKVLHSDLILCNLLGCSSAEQIESSLTGSNGLLSAIVAWGIPNVVGFLWPVPDDVAAAISTRFYEKWLRQQGSARECLRLSLLEDDRDWGPAIWGSAVCYGA